MVEETSGGSIGTARIDVIVGTDQMDVAIERAKSRLSSMSSEAQKAYAGMNSAEKKRIDSLIKQADTIGFTREQQILYNAALKGTPIAILDELKAKIGGVSTATAQAATAATKAFSGTKKSAKELQFAMRGLPAQITDIFTSIASGQRPMMVLLQQGGQLKDMFGGIRPAAAALGSSLLGLVNPYTVVATAAGALLLAWKQGEDEGVAYNKALISTGNYAGVTSSQLSEMARRISQNVGTQHEAAAALAEVAATGKFTADQLALVGRASVDASRVNGQATAETIKQFESLKNEPVKAVLALNDAQHFLTLASYDRIKALDEEGRQQDAATLAMQTYSAALEDRRSEVVRNAGLIEKAWAGVLGTAKSAWDAMLGIGRDDTDAGRIARLQAQLASESVAHLGQPQPLARYNAKTASYESTGAGAMFGHDPVQDQIKQLKELQAKLSAGEDKIKKEAAADRLVQDKAASDAEVMAFATNAQKRATEIARVQGEYRERLARAEQAGNQKLANELRASEKLVLAGINQKYKDPKQPKNPEISAYQTFKGQVDALHIPNVTADNAALTQYQQGVAKLADEMAVYMQKGGDATKAAALFNQGQKELAQTLDRNRQQEVDAEKAYADALDKSNHALAEQVNAQIERIGSGQKEYERTTQITKAYRDQAAALQDLALKRQMGVDGKSGGISQDQYDADVKKLKAATDEKVRILQDGFKRQDAAQADWLNGASMAYHDYVDQAADVAGQTYDLFNNTFTGLSDSLASFVTTGKLNFKSLASSILSDLAKMEARILASKILQGIVGAVLGSSGGNGEMATSFDSNGTFFSPYAKGGVFANSPSLSAYSGQVVSQPTMFAFARGAGVMGEAGPEAIMPLRRGSDGRLGVAASGGASDVEVQINITNKGQPVQAQESGRRMDGKKMMIDLILDTVSGDTAKGGRTAQATAQRFGLQRRGVPVGG